MRQLGFYQGDFEHWIVMEFMECGDLQSFLAKPENKKGIQPSSLALQLSANVMEGLVFLHSHNIIHRDLKPANILLTTSPQGGSLIAKLAGTYRAFSRLKKSNQFSSFPFLVIYTDFGMATTYDGSGSSMMGMAGTPRCTSLPFLLKFSN